MLGLGLFVLLLTVLQLFLQAAHLLLRLGECWQRRFQSQIQIVDFGLVLQGLVATGCQALHAHGIDQFGLWGNQTLVLRQFTLLGQGCFQIVGTADVAKPQIDRVLKACIGLYVLRQAVGQHVLRDLIAREPSGGLVYRPLVGRGSARVLALAQQGLHRIAPCGRNGYVLPQHGGIRICPHIVGTVLRQQSAQGFVFGFELHHLLLALLRLLLRCGQCGL